MAKDLGIYVNLAIRHKKIPARKWLEPSEDFIWEGLIWPITNPYLVKTSRDFAVNVSQNFRSLRFANLY